LDEAARERHALGQDLKLAIEHRELELHYQVQTSVSTGEICGYEVLLRWNHPIRGSVAPTVFIPVAEETGSIIAIGEWVLRTACREAARWGTPAKSP
jgi:diguanylate cyclase